jgi:hypothetical protein
LVNFYQTTRCYNPEDSNLQEGVMLATRVFPEYDGKINFEC